MRAGVGALLMVQALLPSHVLRTGKRFGQAAGRITTCIAALALLLLLLAASLRANRVRCSREHVRLD